MILHILAYLSYILQKRKFFPFHVYHIGEYLPKVFLCYNIVSRFSNLSQVLRGDSTMPANVTEEIDMDLKMTAAVINVPNKILGGEKNGFPGITLAYDMAQAVSEAAGTKVSCRTINGTLRLMDSGDPSYYEKVRIAVKLQEAFLIKKGGRLIFTR